MTPQMTAPRLSGISEGRGANQRDRRPHRSTATLPVQIAAPADLVVHINMLHDRACKSARDALESASHCGALLITAKGALLHGAWLPWVKKHCRFSESTAQRYMKLSEGWAQLEKTRTVRDLGLRDALKLLAEPRKKSLTGPKTEEPHLVVHPETARAPRPSAKQQRQALDVLAKTEGVDQVDEHDVQHHQPGGAEVVHQQAAAGRMKIADIKVMPTGYWRDHSEVQPQLLAHLIESWDESSDETRREFFLILNGRDEFMPVVNAITKAAT